MSVAGSGLQWPMVRAVLVSDQVWMLRIARCHQSVDANRDGL